MRFSTLAGAAAALFISTVTADGAAIVDALTTVDQETQQLESIVSNWDGGLFGSFPIVVQSLRVLDAIKDGTDTADESAPLTTDEALSIATSVSSLGTTVNGTMTAIINAHDDFEHLLIAPLVLLNLKQQKSATDDMSAAIIAKVPQALQAIATNLVAPVDDAFNEAIEVFSLSNGI